MKVYIKMEALQSVELTGKKVLKPIHIPYFLAETLIASGESEVSKINQMMRNSKEKGAEHKRPHRRGLRLVWS